MGELHTSKVAARRADSFDSAREHEIAKSRLRIIDACGEHFTDAERVLQATGWSFFS